MQRLKLKAHVREEVGSRSARRLRDGGKVPAVLYGHHQTPVNLAVNSLELRQVAQKNALITLEFGDEMATVVIKDLQWTPVKHELIHADLQAVKMDEMIHISVPVRLQGGSEIERKGGIIQHILHNVEVACLPTEMLEFLDLDISMLEVGDTVTVDQLVLNSDVTIITPAKEVIATITTSRVGVDEDSTEEQGIATMPEIDAKHDSSAEEATNREEMKTE